MWSVSSNVLSTSTRKTKGNRSLISLAPPMNVRRRERIKHGAQAKSLGVADAETLRSVHLQLERSSDRRSAVTGNHVPDVLRRFHHGAGAGALQRFLIGSATVPQHKP